MDRDQATKLRMLAKKKGIKQGNDVLTYSSFINGEYPEDAAPDATSRTNMIMWGIAALLSLAILAYAIYDKRNKDEMLSLAGQRRELANQVQLLATHVSRLQDDFEHNLTRNAQLVMEKNSVEVKNGLLQQQLGNIEHEKMLITRQLAETTDKAARSQQQQAELQKQISDLRVQLNQISQNMQAAGTSQSESLAGAVGGVSRNTENSIGSIMLINADYGFIVVNCGKAQGVVRDALLEVVRNDNVIGKVKVIDSRQGIAAADAHSIIGSVAVGDTIRRIW